VLRADVFERYAAEPAAGLGLPPDGDGPRYLPRLPDGETALFGRSDEDPLDNTGNGRWKT
jgi:hypothetical protein